MTHTRQLIAFLTWAIIAAIPPLTGWFAMERWATGSNYGAAYLSIGILIVGGLVLIGALISAVITGIATRTKLATLLGVLVGLIASVVAIDARYDANRQQELAPLRPEYEELRTLAATVHSHDRVQIEQQLGTLQHFSVPRAICALTQENPIGSYSYLFGDSEHIANQPIPTQQMMQVADIVAASSLPESQKEAALYVVLTMLTKKETVAIFPAWINLWKQAHPAAPVKYLQSPTPYDAETSTCEWSSTEELAQTPLLTWKDEAIRVWLDNGLAFTPEQHRYVLNAVERATTLTAAINAGVNPNAVTQGHETWPVMASLATPLMWRLFNDQDPNDVAQLVAAFVQHGTNVKALTPATPLQPEGASACEIFRSSANCPCEDESTEHKQARLRAVKKIEQLVCVK